MLFRDSYSVMIRIKCIAHLRTCFHLTGMSSMACPSKAQTAFLNIPEDISAHRSRCPAWLWLWNGPPSPAAPWPPWNISSASGAIQNKWDFPSAQSSSLTQRQLCCLLTLLSSRPSGAEGGPLHLPCPGLGQASGTVGQTQPDRSGEGSYFSCGHALPVYIPVM